MKERNTIKHWREKIAELKFKLELARFYLGFFFKFSQ